ncbi:MAG: glycosyltransferase [Patescibacteria group bacterium]
MNPTKLLMISTDRKIFEEDSAVRARMIEYGKLFGETHIIVFAKNNRQPTTDNRRLSDNTFVYSTNSLSKFFYIFDAVRIGKSVIENCKPARPAGGLKIENCLITTQDPFECGLVGWRLARKFKIPLELQIHTDIGSPYFTSLKLGWRLATLNFLRFQSARFLLPRADKIRVVSVRIKNYLISRFKIAEAKIEIRPIKIDEAKIQRAVVSPENDLRKKYYQFDFIALAAGRLEPEKNFALAIDVWRAVIKKFPRAGLIIVGAGSLEKNLKLFAQGGPRKARQDNVVFEPWTENLASYYKTADVFLNTSFYEGYGMTLAEAVVADCPVISSDVGVIDEIYRSGKKAAICSVGDKNCFVAEINRLFK